MNSFHSTNTRARRYSTNVKSRSQGFVSNLAVVTMSTLALFSLAGKEIGQAYDLFNRAQQNACSQAEKDGLAGIVGTAKSDCAKTASSEGLSSTLVDTAALNQWQMAPNASRTQLPDNSSETSTNSQARTDWWYYSGHLKANKSSTGSF